MTEEIKKELTKLTKDELQFIISLLSEATIKFKEYNTFALFIEKIGKMIEEIK